MNRIEKTIQEMQCYIYPEEHAKFLLIQPVDEHDLELLDWEIDAIRTMTGGAKPFTLAAFRVNDWYRELSPWEAPPVYGSEAFGDGAADTLAFIADQLIPALQRDDLLTSAVPYLLGGYSLAGLFSLWAAYQTERFSGIAAVSPSVWFPSWDSFASSHDIRAQSVYLSLGDREEKTRNSVMASVGDRIRRQHELLSKTSSVLNCTLEWNKGNHFVESDVRMAKGFAWLLERAESHDGGMLP